MPKPKALKPKVKGASSLIPLARPSHPPTTVNCPAVHRNTSNCPVSHSARPAAKTRSTKRMLQLLPTQNKLRPHRAAVPEMREEGPGLHGPGRALQVQGAACPGARGAGKGRAGRPGDIRRCPAPPLPARYGARAWDRYLGSSHSAPGRPGPRSVLERGYFFWFPNWL